MNVVENISRITPESSKLSPDHKKDTSEVTNILHNSQNSSVISNIKRSSAGYFDLPKAKVSEINKLLMSLNTKKSYRTRHYTFKDSKFISKCH